jgi:hypothetical protein
MLNAEGKRACIKEYSTAFLGLLCVVVQDIAERYLVQFNGVNSPTQRSKNTRFSYARDFDY